MMDLFYLTDENKKKKISKKKDFIFQTQVGYRSNQISFSRKTDREILNDQKNAGERERERERERKDISSFRARDDRLSFGVAFHASVGYGL